MKKKTRKSTEAHRRVRRFLFTVIKGEHLPAAFHDLAFVVELPCWGRRNSVRSLISHAKTSREMYLTDFFYGKTVCFFRNEKKKISPLLVENEKGQAPM